MNTWGKFGFRATLHFAAGLDMGNGRSAQEVNKCCQKPTYLVESNHKLYVKGVLIYSSFVIQWRIGA